MDWPGAVADGLHVGRLQMHRGAGRVPSRAGIESALADVGAAAIGLPRTAWFIARRVTCRAGLPTVARNPLHGALMAALEGELRRAARPWLAPAPAACTAVWFSDQDELAACLVRDWLRGVVHECWWWRPVLAGASAQVWLRQQLLQRGERLVPVLAQLAQHGQAVAFVSRLEPSDVSRAVQALAAAYAIPSPAVPAPPESVAAGHGAGETAPPGEHASGSTGAGPASRRRLLAVVPELGQPALQPEAARLLAWALVAVREPAWLRTGAFEQTLSAWLDAASPRRAEPLRPQPHDGSAVGAGATRAGAAAPPRAAPGDGTPLEVPSGEGAANHAQRAAALAVAAACRVVEAVHDRRAAAGQSVVDVAHPVLRRETDGSAETFTPPDPAWQNPLPAAMAMAPRDAALQPVDTEFGGVFYLLNAALVLGLYGDFTMPRAPSLALSPWDWLALTGRHWFGDDFVHDPLWAVLAGLAGRHQGQEPGADFIAPAQWAVSDDWLAPWGEVTELGYHATRTRLRLWHPRGFALFDMPRDPQQAPMAQARALCAPCRWLRGARLQRVQWTAPGPPRLAPAARWLIWLLPYLRARLAISLGCTGTEADVLRLVCRHAAQVSWTVSKVEVHLPLATLPIRFAGLDRDPGWIPAAGRSVYLHFA